MLFRFIARHPNIAFQNPMRAHKYFRLYVHMHQQNHLKYQQYQSQVDNHTNNSKQTVFRYIKQLPNKIQQFKQYVYERKGKITVSDISIEIKGVMNQFFQYLSLYYESLQNLVEGRRQVLQNQDFKFEDGKSVKQKREIFEQRLMKLQGKAIKKGAEWKQKVN